ncbi:MAG: tRNA (guanosine(46)-N7)-methyltransferase TrmB [Clostridia bacterium]|nr:tRNA (guanosine(46)-N7)-methyltransferase TrmB [Clostridia bacterium]
MRMRRKKHREERLESCADIMIKDIFEYKEDMRRAFDQNRPLHLEIGCGKGGFISTLAELNPDINYIAFEKNLDVLVLAMEKVCEKGLDNVRFVAGDAEALGQLDEQYSAERIYINFCDPWHKWGHRKRRLTHERYLAIYERLMPKGGEIHFKTDNAPLFEFSLNSFSDYGMKLKNITLDLHNSKFEGNVMTEYEKLFSEKGQPIYRCEALFTQRSDEGSER